jgi:hypothetical protein
MSDRALDYSILPRRTRTIVQRAAVFTAAAILAAAVPARAQLVDTLKFQTSFPFMIGRTTMPAGAYTITPVQGDNALMRLSNGQASVLVFTENDSPQHPPKIDEVTFTRHGDRYVLSSIWDAGTVSGVEPVASAHGTPAHAGDEHVHGKAR